MLRKFSRQDVMEEEKCEKKKGRMLSAKKKMASKISESKLGRSALTKFMGPEGDAIVGALKSAVSKSDDHATAKDLKKDLMKWVLKASLLFQNKSLTAESIQHMKRPAHICAERMVEICETTPVGQRDMSQVAEEFRALLPLLKKLLEPHSQDKNVDKVEKLVKYYSDPLFLNKLFNDPSLKEERETIVEGTRAILLPLPSALHDEQSIKTAQFRAKVIEKVLAKQQDISICFDKENPVLGTMFASYLDAQPDKLLGLALRFLLSEKEYSEINSHSLRASRARVICSKFLSPVDQSSACNALAIPTTSATLQPIQNGIEEQRLSKTAFADVRNHVLAMLQPAFAAFLASPEFLTYKQTLQRELEQLRKTYGERLSPPPPADSFAVASSTFSSCTTSNSVKS